MTSGNYISYKHIQGLLDMQYPAYIGKIPKDLLLETIARVLRLGNRPEILKKKYGFMQIANGRGNLPSDVHNISSAGVSFASSLEAAMCDPTPLIPMLHMFDTMAHQQTGNGRFNGHGSSYTYDLNDGQIIPNFQTGIIVIAYEALPLDNEGFPQVPDDQPWIEAAVHSAAEQYSFQEYIRNPSSAGIYDEIKGKAKKARQYATNFAKMPSNDKRQAMANNNLKSIPNTTAHNSFFQHFQWPESRRVSGVTSSDNFTLTYA